MKPSLCIAQLFGLPATEDCKFGGALFPLTEFAKYISKCRLYPFLLLGLAVLCCMLGHCLDNHLPCDPMSYSVACYVGEFIRIVTEVMPAVSASSPR